jgi:hypothetical protein
VCLFFVLSVSILLLIKRPNQTIIANVGEMHKSGLEFCLDWSFVCKRTYIMDRSFVCTSILLQPGFCFIDSLCLHKSAAATNRGFCPDLVPPSLCFSCVLYVFLHQVNTLLCIDLADGGTRACEGGAGITSMKRALTDGMLDWVRELAEGILEEGAIAALSVGGTSPQTRRRRPQRWFGSQP